LLSDIRPVNRSGLDSELPHPEPLVQFNGDSWSLRKHHLLAARMLK
jgi:hypothetical protein